MDLAVFVFGLFVSTIMGLGILLLYAGAYVHEAERANHPLPKAVRALLRGIGFAVPPDPS